MIYIDKGEQKIMTIEYRWRNPETGKDYTVNTFIDLLELMKSQGYRYGKYRFYRDGKLEYVETVE